METTIGARTWRENDADALETRAEAIERATIPLEDLDGMFDDRPELRSAVAGTLDLLRIETENLRTAATRLRGTKSEVVDLASKKRARS